MIPANELRKGNKFQFELRGRLLYGTCVTIVDLGCDSQYDDPYYKLIGGLAFITYGTIEPIPLTPEILEKCGFHNVPYGLALRCKNGGNESVIASLFSGFPLTIEVYGMRTPLHHITHLHQLQNLYFSLTGTELEINL